MKYRRSRKVKAMIELTPLVDMVFLLLIFFMTTTTFIKNENSVNINLPRGGERAEQKLQQVVIKIDENGRFFLNDAVIDSELLGIGLRNALSVADDKNVVIKADKNVAYEKVMYAMDSAKKGGAARLYMAAAGTLNETQH